MSSLDRNIFELQPLEIRTLLASASVDGTNTLQISVLSDPASTIIVNKISNGKITVTVNGATVGPQFTAGNSAGQFNKINIQGSGFNDNITISSNFDYSGGATVSGNNGNDRLNGGRGNDLLSGLAGNDTLDGGIGNDQLAGGNNFDQTNYSTRTGALRVTLDNIANDGEVGLGEADNVQTEEVIGGAGNDTMTGSSGDDFFGGGAGADSLSGGGGNDELVGSGSQDKLFGQEGDDFLQAQNNDQDTVNGGTGPGVSDFDLANIDGIDVASSASPASPGAPTGWAADDFVGPVSSIEPSIGDIPRTDPLFAPVTGIPSDLDTSYGDGGKVSQSLGWEPVAAAVDSQGRVVFVGTDSGQGYGDDFAVARFNATGAQGEFGALDTTFGNNGQVRIDFTDVSGSGYGNDNDVARGVAIGPGDKIIVVGSSSEFNGEGYNSSDSAVARLTNTGAADSTFGSNGRKIVDAAAGDDDSAVDAVVQSNGSIVVAGEADQPGAGSALEFDGVDDTAFVPDNAALAEIENNDEFTISAWIRMDSLGSFFTVVDKGGAWTIQGVAGQNLEFAAPSEAVSVPFQPFQGEWNQVAISYRKSDGFMRFFANGQQIGQVATTVDVPRSSTEELLYLGYNPYGATEYFAGAEDELQIWNRALTPAEVAQGYARRAEGNEPGLVGLYHFDEGFGSNFADSTANGNDGSLAETPQTPTWIGSGAAIGGTDAAVFRLSNEGVLDTGFGNGGVALVDLGSTFEQVSSVALQNLPGDDGAQRIIVGGTASGQFALARLTPAGVLDATFGTAGVVRQDFSGGVDQSQLNDLAVDANNNILAAGDASHFIASGPETLAPPAPGTQQAVLAKFDPNGALAGTATYDAVNGFASFGAVTVDSSGRYVAVGFADDDFLVGRITPSMVPDTNFSSTGFVLTDFGDGESFSDDAAFATRVLGDKITAAGRSFVSESTLASIARYQGVATSGNTDAEGNVDEVEGLLNYQDLHQQPPPPRIQAIFARISEGAKFYILSQPDDNGVARLDLSILGDGNDNVLITRVKGGKDGTKGDRHFVSVNVNGTALYYDDDTTTRIEIYTGDGKDTVETKGDIKTPLLIDGGAGDDNITGGKADDILLGGPDKDVLAGREGRDILIGGLGGDNLNGNQEEDILIAGTTAYDDDATALVAIMAEWGSKNHFNTRLGFLRGGGGANGSFVLRGSSFGAGATVFDDSAIDILRGDGGKDWFFAHTGGANADIVTHLEGGDVRDAI